MAVVGVIGSVTGGISAAQQYCRQEAQARQVLIQTQQFVQQSSAIFKGLVKLDDDIKNQIGDLMTQQMEAVNTLNQMKQDYKAEMKKMQIGVALFILIVFMLLLGKKLKIY